LIRLATTLFATGIVVGALGCASSRSRVVEAVPQPKRLPEDLVVLLTDVDGAVGRAVVSTSAGTVDLGVSGASTTVSATQAPSPVAVIADKDIDQMFGQALAALPPPPLRFTFYFEFETQELTLESRASLAAILSAVKKYPAPEVIVVGHTDRMGSVPRNMELGLKRANVVRDLLVAAHVARSAIEISSRGEAEPALVTADEVAEPRNRRVEITVR
jgi:OmpA-OmpF porin, OOP family